MCGGCMRYNEDIEGLLNQIETIVSKEYDESLVKITRKYDTEIVRLNAVIEAYREVATKAQKDADEYEKEIERLCVQIEDLQYDKIGC